MLDNLSTGRIENIKPILDKLAAAFEKAANILRGEGEAARKKLVFSADGALEKKLAAYVQTQEVWAAAYATRKVPNTVFGSSGSGSDGNVNQFMQLLTLQAAKELSVDVSTK